MGPTFNSANGTTSSNNIGATFGAPGSYVFTVTLSATGQTSISQSVTVIVNQTASSLTVSPKTATISVGQTQPFTAVVKALVADLLTPIIALIFGKPSFQQLSFTINGSHFLYGDFINNVVTFASVAAAVFFFVVTPINRLMARRAEEDPETKECPECTSVIPINARRCPLCTAQIAPASAA